MEECYDVIIIGVGPAGLAAAIYAGRAGRKTLMIEKGSFGGRINDTREIRNYPGFISDSGAGLMQKFKAQRTCVSLLLCGVYQTIMPSKMLWIW